MITLKNIDTTLFKKDITNNFVNNLTEITCSTLANMLAIDYTLRLNSKSEAKKHINNCISKLKNYLGSQVINDGSFSVVLKLFAIMIAPESVERPNKNNLLEPSQDIIVENLVITYFGEEKINSEEKEKIRNIFKNLLQEKNFDNIINYAESNVKLFRTSVMYAIKKYNNIDEINSHIKKEINKILEVSLEFTKKNNAFKQVTGKIAGAICALAVGAISVATAGAAFSIGVIPAAVFAIKYAPKIGERIGELILDTDNSVKFEKRKIDEFTEQLQNNNENLLSQEKTKEIKKDTRLAPSQVNVKLDKKLSNEKHR